MMPTTNNKKRSRSEMLPAFDNDFDLTPEEVAQWFLGEQQAIAFSAAQVHKHILIERLLVMRESLNLLKRAVDGSLDMMEDVKRHFLDPHCPKQYQGMFLRELTNHAANSMQGIAGVMQTFDEYVCLKAKLKAEEVVIDELTKSMRFKG